MGGGGAGQLGQVVQGSVGESASGGQWWRQLPQQQQHHQQQQQQQHHPPYHRHQQLPHRHLRHHHQGAYYPPQSITQNIPLSTMRQSYMQVGSIVNCTPILDVHSSYAFALTRTHRTHSRYSPVTPRIRH